MKLEEQDLLFEDESEGIICGADEAGRGPLAGPVVAAAVVLPPTFPFEILNDSKKLSEEKRLNAEKIIKEKAIYAITFISEKEIDEINILNASLLAMKKSYLEVIKKTHVDLLLVDGNKLPDLECNMKAIVKGDAKIHEIMAASILAKCARDRFMLEMDKQYPEYGFKHHKGYPTEEHVLAIEKYGLSPIHRKSFHLKQKKQSSDPLQASLL